MKDKTTRSTQAQQQATLRTEALHAIVQATFLGRSGRPRPNAGAEGQPAISQMELEAYAEGDPLPVPDLERIQRAICANSRLHEEVLAIRQRIARDHSPLIQKAEAALRAWNFKRDWWRLQDWFGRHGIVGDLIVGTSAGLVTTLWRRSHELLVDDPELRCEASDGRLIFTMRFAPGRDAGPSSLQLLRMPSPGASEGTWPGSGPKEEACPGGKVSRLRGTFGMMEYRMDENEPRDVVVVVAQLGDGRKLKRGILIRNASVTLEEDPASVEEGVALSLKSAMSQSKKLGELAFKLGNPRNKPIGGMGDAPALP